MRNRAGPARDDEAGLPRLRRARHQPDDPAQRACAIERALRPFEDLDPLHVGQAQIRVGRVVAEAQVAEILADGGLRRPGEARIRDPANEQLVAPAAEIGRTDRGGALHDLLGTAHPAAFEHCAVEQRHLPGDFIEGQIALAGGDDDRRAFGLRRGRSRGSGGRNAQRTRALHHRSAARRRRHQPPCLRPDLDRLHPARPRELPHRAFGIHPAPDSGHSLPPQGRVSDDDAGVGRPRNRNRGLGHRASRNRQLARLRSQRRRRGQRSHDSKRGEGSHRITRPRSPSPCRAA